MKQFEVKDYWLRYEWQARGSVHAHYVLCNVYRYKLGLSQHRYNACTSYYLVS